MKVSCEQCNSAFKVKGEVAPGKSFKFKCPKCSHVNKIVAGEENSQPSKTQPTVPCADCGAEVPPPDAGNALCDQCRASRAVEEARQKSQDLMEETGLDFPDEIFDAKEGATPAPSGVSEVPQDEPADEEPTVSDEPPEPASAEKGPGSKVGEEFVLGEEENVEKLGFKKDGEDGAETQKQDADLFAAETAGEKDEGPVDLDKAKYEVRSKDGLAIGPIKLNTLRDLIIAQKVHSDEEIRRNEGSWMSILELPEVFEIFETEKVTEPKKEALTPEEERAKLLEELKLKKKCAGCGAEIYVLEDIPHPLCDQCRIEALVVKKQQADTEEEAKYKIRNPDGLILGPLRMGTVKDLIAAGNIQGHEEISVSGGEWVQIGEIDELAELILGGDDMIELTETIDG